MCAAGPCAPAPAGLIGWWKGEGNGADSAGTNNAYAIANITFTNGVVGQAFACDPNNYPYGTYNAVQIADQPAYALTNSLSIEAWVRPRGDGFVIFWRGDNRVGLDPYYLSMQGNTGITFGISDAAGNSASVSAPLAYNQWWHVAATLDGASGTMNLYTNGTLAAQSNTTVRPFGLLIPEDSPGIGIGNVNDGFNNFPFTGDIDEVALYNRALTAAEVQGIYDAGSAGKCAAAPCAPAPAGLIGWWKGDGNGADSAGTNNAYAVVNISFTNGIVGQAFACDPENYPYFTYTGVQIADQPAYALTNSLSIEAWIRPRGDGYNIFWRGDNRPGLDPYVLEMLGNHNVAFIVADANNNSATLSAPLVYNQWWHVAATLDGSSGTMSLYTNGTLAGQLITSIRPFGDLIAQDSPGIGIGNVNDGFNRFPFVGDIDEVALYNRALTASEVQGIYNAGSAGKCTTGNALSILVQPASQVVGAGDSAMFSVTALGTPPLAYQWRLNGTNLSAATGSSLALSNVQVSAVGSYSVVVSNGAGTALSSNAVLTVLQPVYSAGEGFSPSANPAGPWSYGYSLTLGSPMVVYPESLQDVPGLEVWRTNIWLGAPSVFYNATNSPISNGTVTVDPGVTGAHPGPNGEYSIIRFIVPATRLYRVSCLFYGLDTHGTTTDVHVLTNGLSIFDGAVNGYGAGTGPDFNSAILLNAGDTLDFAVGRGADNDFSYDSTALLIQVAPVPAQSGCVPPPAGLVGWWRGENSTADAMGANNGTVAGYGTFGYGPGMVGQAFLLDGIHRDRVDVGNPPSLQLQDFTIEAWVKRADPADISLDDDNQDGAVAGEGGIVFGYGRGGYGLGLLNNGRMILSKIDVDNVQSAGTVTDTNWHHVAVTKAGSTAVFYIDGAPASGALPYSTTYTFTESAAVGSRGDARGGTFWGMVDEPSVYNRALSAAEIERIYLEGSAGKCVPPICAAPPAGLIGWWKGDGNGADSAGTNNASAVLNTSFTNGIVGQAFAFDPENYPYGWTGVQIPDQPAYALTNSLSVEAWVRPRGDGWNIFWRGDNRPGLDPYVLEMMGNTNLLFGITDVNGNSASVSAPLVYNQWWHVAATLDGGSGTMSLYTNGTLAAQTNTTVRPFGPLIPAASPGIGIGNVNDGFNSFPFLGDIDEVSLYNRALTVGEIQGVYNAGAAGKCVSPMPPAILIQPISQVVTSGSAVSFSVLASGSPPLSYQWALNGTNLAAGTGSSLLLTNVQLADAGSYSVLVSNTAGAVLSSNAVLTILLVSPCAPEPGGLVDWWPGQSNALDVIGANNGTVVGGVTYTQGVVGQAFLFDGNDSYVDFGTNVGNFGTSDFSVEFWLSTVSTRNEALLSKRNICDADNLFNVLLQQGALAFEVDGGASSYGFFGWNDARAVNDGTFHHTVLVRHGPTLSIYVDGVFSSGGTLSSGQVADVSSGGHFYAGTSPCVGVDGTASYTGALDEISLYSRALAPVEIQALYAAGRSGKCTTPTPPTVSVPPASVTVTALSNAIFYVAADGTAPLSYQWRFNSAALPGQTDDPLVLAAVSPSQAGSYDVVVTNAFGAVTSAAAVLTVYVPPGPGFSLQPQGQAVPAGTNVTLTATATNDWPISYQWYFGGTALAGATSTSLILTDVQTNDAGDYVVVAANAWNAATSAVATLTVLPAAPLVTLQPQAAGVFPGFPAQLSVAAAGSEPFAYQWQLYGTNIPGATGATYVIPNMTPADAGPYQAVISNAFGGTNSSEAVLVTVPVACWGATSIGQMSLPVSVSNAVAVSAGTLHNLALRRDGTVVAWGAADQVHVPATLTNAVAIAAGGDHSVALKADGTVAAWGGPNNAGQTNAPAGLSNVVAVAAGASHSLALKADGTVAAWGLNISGQASVPALLTNVVAVSAGSNHSIALRADGKVFAWGGNTAGQTNVPASLTDVVAIAAGAMHSVALRSDGTVVAWGSSTYGQTNVPSGLSNVIALGAGAFHSLAVKGDGTVVAWGAGTSSMPSTFPNLGQSYIPPAATNMVAASGGQAHTLALAGDGPPFFVAQPLSRAAFSGRRTVFRAQASGVLPFSYQWQLNGTNAAEATRQLLAVDPATNSGSYTVVITNVLGAATSSVAVLNVVNSAPFVAVQPVGQPVYLGTQASLQVTADGSAPFSYQWRLDGTNIAGATGSTLLINHLVLSDAGGYSVVISNAFGAVSSAKATVPVIQTVAWGAGTNYGTTPNYGQSIVPAGLVNAVAVAGGGYHSLALKADTGVLAWGAGTTNSGVVLGRGGPEYGQSIVPDGLANVTGIAAGLYHSLAATASGSIIAWGAGDTTIPVIYYAPNYGQSVVPASASNVVAVAASDYDSFALRSDGKVVAWGENTYFLTNPPSSVSNVVALAARGSHALAMRSDGTVISWGNLTASAPTPPYPYSYVAIAAGVNHSLALRSDGTVVSWGGQYGVPSGLANVVAIAAGYDHSLALRSDGTVVTWGATNTYGRNLIPPGLTNVIGIGCGYYHSLAVLGDGSPFIKLQPANRAALIGTSTNFVAMAVGSQPLHFQWQFNGTNLSGATSSLFTLSSVQAPNAGGYRVVITNVYGAVTSSVAPLTTLVPLGQALSYSFVWSTSGNAAWFGESAVTHDQSSAAQSGAITDSQSSTLQTTITGPGTLTFWWKVSSEQWFDYLSFYVDSVLQAAISGNTGWLQQTSHLAGGTHTLTWTYAKDPSVSVGTDAGWLDQVSFVADPPVITLQPLSQHGTMGNPIALTVAATGVPSLSYQWWKDGAPLSNATSAAYTITSATRRDSGVYRVGVSNPGGTTYSSNATLVVRSPQKLGAPQPLTGGGLAVWSGDADAGTLLPGDLPNFQAQASTNLVDWVALLNCLTVTNGMLYLVDPDSRLYPCRFYRIIELDDSTCVTNPPVITIQPAGQTVLMGAGVTMNVAAYGAPPLRYQWMKDGINLAGATGSSLFIATASRPQSGAYAALVSNPVGQVCSSNAVLVVRVPESLGCPIVLPDGTLALLAGPVDGFGLAPGDLPRFQAQASTNLVDWITLPNSLTLTNGLLRLWDPASTNCPSRYYRIIGQ
ncbi:MAG TPA: LamG-like jellyroll fold domain-containing protein [Candidatus Acidoferrum sp.]|nr:LamG-like jellyroll fold domain-containing protein [Candidatus Acidoferrum sp.]